ncbi:MAG TPA: hypothetical protein DDY68_05825 [Porphyromonadaceae bacterium]|nr:hypothetical protein [Porphyromonadaceae bacterium]
MTQRKFAITLWGMFFWLFPTMVYSQFKAIKPETFWGVSLGGCFSKVNFTPSLKTKMHTGVTLGASFRYIAEEYVGLLVELNYQQAGWKDNLEGTPYTYERTLNYLELPAYVHIYFGKKKYRFYINIGPQFNFLIGESEKANFAFDGSVTNNKYYQHYGKKVEKKIDYGLSGGVGFEWRTGVGCFLIGGSYYFGFSNLFNNDLSDTFSGSSNSIISLKLSYLFQVR